MIATQNQTQVETTTEIEVTTITAQPGTVTIALQGPDAISSSLSSAFSVESQQLEINSQLAPNNPFRSAHPPPTSATRFTRTIVVPVVEATKTSAASGQTSATDVYFIGESNGTTTWLSNFTPHESMTIGTTTVTLSPVASVTANRTNSSRLTGHATYTNSSRLTGYATYTNSSRLTGYATYTNSSRLTGYATYTNTVTVAVSQPSSLSSASGSNFTGVGYQGWNTSTLTPATGLTSGRPYYGGATNVPSSLQTVTIRRSYTIATTTQTSAASGPLPTNPYGSSVNITFSTAGYDHQKRSGEDGRRRAICEWVTATMHGTPVSWPNNWDGSKTVDCASVTQNTTQPQPTPGVYCKIKSVVVQTKSLLATTPYTVTVTVGSTAPSTELPTSNSASLRPTNTPVSSTSTGAAPAATTSCGVSGDFTLDVYFSTSMFGVVLTSAVRHITSVLRTQQRHRTFPSYLQSLPPSLLFFWLGIRATPYDPCDASKWKSPGSLRANSLGDQ